MYRGDTSDWQHKQYVAPCAGATTDEREMKHTGRL
jgi:hypothetical protein